MQKSNILLAINILVTICFKTYTVYFFIFFDVFTFTIFPNVQLDLKTTYFQLFYNVEHSTVQ